MFSKNQPKEFKPYATDKYNVTQDGEIDIVEFQKEHPYIMDVTLYRYGLEKDKEVIKGYTIYKI